MMLEYESNIEDTKTTIRVGIIYTSDIGVLDDEGFLSITNRKKDVVLVKGVNVFPREIEEQLMSQSNVSFVWVVPK